MAASIDPDMFEKQYGQAYTANETWNAIPDSDSELYPWSADSTYIQEPPFFTEMTADVQPISIGGFAGKKITLWDIILLLFVMIRVSNSHLSIAYFMHV